MKKFRIGALVQMVVYLLLGSCATVPLSTLVRMNSFNEGEFANLQPEELRVRIKLPEGFALDIGKSWFEIEIGSVEGVHNATLKLDEVLSRRVLLSTSFFKAKSPSVEYVLRLSEPSRATFRELQSFVHRAPTEEINIRVVPKLAAAPPDAIAVKVWIDLFLSEAQGYFALVDGATISLENWRKATSSRLRTPPAGSPSPNDSRAVAEIRSRISLSGVTLQGEEFSLVDQLGKVVIINVFGPCGLTKFSNHETTNHSHHYRR